MPMPWSLQQAAYQLWCCARPGPAPNVGTQPIDAQNRRVLASVFGQDEVLISIEYESRGPDADEFDRAFYIRDFEALARLLDSEQRVDRFVEPKHPWAEDPRTVGALAAVQLALMASVAAHGDQGMKIDILQATGATGRLIAFLVADEPDRAQAAVVALSYLTDECPPNAVAVYEAGAMEMLIGHLDSPVAGMRGAAASTLRHMCMVCEAYTQAFMASGGLKGFVSQLDPHLDNTDLMLEAIWNLEDVITGPDGNLVEHYVKLAVDEGVLDKLEKFRSIGEDEVGGAAEKVLRSLIILVKDR